MSQMRQRTLVDPRTGARGHVTTFAHDFPDQHVIAEHSHEAEQLAFASSGVMTLRTPHGIWVVPSQRAVWIAARVPHSITMSGPVRMRTLYFPPGFMPTRSRPCAVINVAPLLRELIVH